MKENDVSKTTAEKISIMQAHERGEEIEVKNKMGNDWSLTTNPKWDWFRYIYRIAAPMPRQHQIDWTHVADGFNWIYTANFYGDGELVLISNHKPVHDSSGFYLDVNSNSKAMTIEARWFSSFKAGNIPWEQSLVERPKQP